MPRKSTKNKVPKYNEKEADFLNRTPIMYRRSIIKIFRDFTDKNSKHEMGRPERIVEEFSEILGEDVNDVHNNYYEKIQNIRKGSNAVLNQEDLFDLVETFLWKYCEDKVLALNTGISILEFGKHQSRYYPMPSIVNQLPDRDEIYDELLYLESDTFYEADFGYSIPTGTSWKERIEFEESIEKAPPILRKYFYFKDVGKEKFDLVICFCNTDHDEIYYGVHNREINVLFLKELDSNSPMFIYYPTSPTYPKVTQARINMMQSVHKKSKYSRTISAAMIGKHMRAEYESIGLRKITDDSEKISLDEKLRLIAKYMDYNIFS